MSGVFRHRVSAAGQGERLDAYLGSLDATPSRSACARLIEAGAVLVNGEVETSKKRVLCEGDGLELSLPDETPEPTLAPEPIPLDIRYEDDHLIVLSKQAGLVCHPAVGHASGTLANALVYHCGPEHLGRLQGDDRPGIVHRLDRDTSGLMLAAKDDATQRPLQDLIRLRTLDRRYITLVHGYIAPDTGIVVPVRPSPRSRCSSALRRVRATTATRCSSAISTPAARTRSACTCAISGTRA